MSTEQNTQRLERCTICNLMVSDWVDPDWSNGRICRNCETIHEPKQPPPETGAVDVEETIRACAAMILNPHYESFGKAFQNDASSAEKYIRELVAAPLTARIAQLEKKNERLRKACDQFSNEEIMQGDLRKRAEAAEARVKELEEQLRQHDTKH